MAGKQPQPQWLSMRAAIEHCRAGAGVWEWAGNAGRRAPDVVLACAGDVPTLETLAAAQLLREHLPALRVRVVNVVDLMALLPPSLHPHGLPDRVFDSLFTRDRPVVFAYHGYPSLIHRLVYRRTNHANFHVRGYREEGTTTTPFDMVVRNGLDRFNLVLETLRRAARPSGEAPRVAQAMRRHPAEHQRHVVAAGEDLPVVRDWRWRMASG